MIYLWPIIFFIIIFLVYLICDFFFRKIQKNENKKNQIKNTLGVINNTPEMYQATKNLKKNKKKE